jgi:PAS domain S-box-containing protein
MHEESLQSDQMLPETSLYPEVEEILDLIGDGIICVDERGRIILFNRAAEELFGYRSAELIGTAIDALIPMRFHDAHRNHVNAYVSTVVPTRRSMGVGRSVMGLHRSGHEFSLEATLSSHMFAGQRTFTAVVRDVSDRHTAEEKRRLIAAEVAHRLRNTTTVINSIVSMTARSATSLPAFIDALAGRFAAITRMNEVLIGAASIDSNFRSLLLSELAAFQNRDGRIVLEGPDLKIGGRLALDLALLIHELATNAVKYGALSSPEGDIRVGWHITAGDVPALEIVWQENGGPIVTEPKKSGFGSRLISGILSSHGGTTRLTYDPDGIICKVSVALE